jgi:hypothetical protein
MSDYIQVITTAETKTDAQAIVNAVVEKRVVSSPGLKAGQAGERALNDKRRASTPHWPVFTCGQA